MIAQWISHCHRPWSLSVAIYISSGRCRKQLKNYNKAGIQQFCIGPLYHHSISCRDSVEKVQRHASGWAMQDYKLTSSINCHAWRAELNIAAVKKEESRLSMLYRFRDYLLSIDSKHSPASGNQRKSCCPTNTYSIDMPFCWTLYQQQTSHHILVEHSQTASLKLLPQPHLWLPLTSLSSEFRNTSDSNSTSSSHYVLFVYFSLICLQYSK